MRLPVSSLLQLRRPRCSIHCGLASVCGTTRSSSRSRLCAVDIAGDAHAGLQPRLAGVGFAFSCFYHYTTHPQGLQRAFRQACKRLCNKQPPTPAVLEHCVLWQPPPRTHHPSDRKNSKPLQARLTSRTHADAFSSMLKVMLLPFTHAVQSLAFLRCFVGH